MRRLWILLLPFVLVIAACERGPERDIGSSGTGEAPVNSGEGVSAGLPNDDPSPGGEVPEMQTPGGDNIPDGAFVLEGTIRRDAQGVWTLENERQPIRLIGLPEAYQRDGLRTKVRLEWEDEAATPGQARTAARVIEIGDVL
jgi:hypothetical protein